MTFLELTAPGWGHFLLALCALTLGLVITLNRKGTQRHKLLGRLYVGAMVLLNVLAFFIYADSQRPGIFHVLAVVSLATIITGLFVLRRDPKSIGNRIRHGYYMSWSLAGLTAAGVGQFVVLFGLPPLPAIVFSLIWMGFYIHSRNMDRMAGAKRRWVYTQEH